MNQNQWQKKQAQTALEQKQHAKNAVLAKYGVKPAPPKIKAVSGYKWSEPPIEVLSAYDGYIAFADFGTLSWNGDGTLTYSSTPPEPSTISELVRLCPALQTANKKCPECTLYHALATVIMHLNDQHHWSRQKIADWLEIIDVDLTIKTA